MARPRQGVECLVQACRAHLQRSKMRRGKPGNQDQPKGNRKSGKIQIQGNRKEPGKLDQNNRVQSKEWEVEPGGSPQAMESWTQLLIGSLTKCAGGKEAIKGSDLDLFIQHQIGLSTQPVLILHPNPKYKYLILFPKSSTLHVLKS